VPRRTRLRSDPATRRPALFWAEAPQLFLQEERLKGRRPRTWRRHVEVFSVTRKELDALGAPDEPRALTREHLAALVRSPQERGRQPRTINVRLQSLRQLFAFLMERGECRQNPAAELPLQRDPRRMPRALDDREVQRLLAAIDRSTFVGLRDFTIVVLLLDTGIRLSELVQIRSTSCCVAGRAAPCRRFGAAAAGGIRAGGGRGGEPPPAAAHVRPRIHPQWG
jgi:site-specific recombinase XerC